MMIMKKKKKRMTNKQLLATTMRAYFRLADIVCSIRARCVQNGRYLTYMHDVCNVNVELFLSFSLTFVRSFVRLRRFIFTFIFISFIVLHSFTHFAIVTTHKQARTYTHLSISIPSTRAWFSYLILSFHFVSFHLFSLCVSSLFFSSPNFCCERICFSVIYLIQ